MARAVNVHFGDGWLEFEAYPFAEASVRALPRVAAAEVAEVDPAGFPPLLRVGDELLFVHAAQKAELEEWAARHGVAVRSRFDVWAALLEPALDTPLSPDDLRRSFGLLKRHGLTEEEVVGMRARVLDPMRLWNIESMAWEWVHLGLFDALSVLLGRPGFEEFYVEAMELALRPYAGP